MTHRSLGYSLLDLQVAATSGGKSEGDDCKFASYLAQQLDQSVHLAPSPGAVRIFAEQHFQKIGFYGLVHLKIAWTTNCYVPLQKARCLVFAVCKEAGKEAEMRSCTYILKR